MRVARCVVCGYRPAQPPWGESGQDPTWELCPCCGAEFGYEDATPAGVRQFRERWLAAGGGWSDPSVPADGLTTDERLARLGPDALLT